MCKGPRSPQSSRPFVFTCRRLGFTSYPVQLRASPQSTLSLPTARPGLDSLAPCDRRPILARGRIWSPVAHGALCSCLELHPELHPELPPWLHPLRGLLGATAETPDSS